LGSGAGAITISFKARIDNGDGGNEEESVVGRGRHVEPRFAAAGGAGAVGPASVAKQKPSPAASTGASVLMPGVVALLVIGILVYGFLHRHENWFTPERGLGYLFGIAGAVMMLILLSYPLRKRVRALRGLGRLPGWLKFHMFLGVAGPSLILFHANFRLGATNSNVALFTMLTVVSSGIVGRYIYSKTHNRLSGELRNLQDLRAETNAARSDAHLDLSGVPELRGELDAIEARILDPAHGILSSTWLYLSFLLSKGGYRRKLLRHLKRAIEADAHARGLDVRHQKSQFAAAARYVTAYLRALQRSAEFRFYERMFALWHVLHVPLLFLLIASALVHVAAVHLY
jgi:hypothetical protein